MYCAMFRRKEMGSTQTLVCVKQVKQDTVEEWDESMPLPGDIIEGFAEDDAHGEVFVPPKAKCDFSSQLGKISQQADAIWVKVRRADAIHMLRVNIVLEKSSLLQKKFTIRAATDERHIAVLGDLTLEQCSELQEMSRRVVNADRKSLNRREVKYDWNGKVGNYLPDPRATVVSSILFMPLQGEYSVEATTTRCMAWFSAAVSSGAPLVFVNIQTEQIMTSEKFNPIGREINWVGRQQNNGTTLQIVQGIRMWFLPGVSEVPFEMTPEPGEIRFGLDIKRTEEGLVCVYLVAEGSAADRAGLRHLHQEAESKGRLLVISRLEGRSVLPSRVSCEGMIECCDQGEIKDTLHSAIRQMEGVQVHTMAWWAAQSQGTLQPPQVHLLPDKT